MSGFAAATFWSAAQSTPGETRRAQVDPLSAPICIQHNRAAAPDKTVHWLLTNAVTSFYF